MRFLTVLFFVSLIGSELGRASCYAGKIQSKQFQKAGEDAFQVKGKGKSLKIGVVSMQTGAILRAGNELGYFDNVGILEFVTFTTAQQVAIAVASGQVDMGQTGLTAAVYNFAKMKKLQIIAGSFREQPGWAGMAYVVSDKAWNKGIQKPQDLKNAKIGITEAGSTMDYTIGLLGEKYKFRVNRGNLITLQAVSNLILAVQSGLVDCIVINAASADHLAKTSKTHTIGYVRDETPWQVVAFFANRQALRQGSEPRKNIASFLDSYKKLALVYNSLFRPGQGNLLTAKEKEDREIMAKCIARFVKSLMTLEQVKNYPPFMDPDCCLDLNSIRHQIHWYQKHKMLDKKLRVDQVVDTSFIVQYTQK